MFRSKRRQVVIPQLEHSRLAGSLALHWGNDTFERPPIDRDSWLAGVTFHDRGYGALDAFAIGEMAEEQWLDLMRASFSRTQHDPAADLIVKLHVRRLLGNEGAPPRQALAAAFDEEIRTWAHTHGLALAAFQRIDRITNFVDRIAFDFSFEAPASGKVAVHPGNDSDQMVELHYSIDGAAIRVHPWPFAVTGYAGFILGYQADGYPQRLEPLIVPYQVAPA